MRIHRALWAELCTQQAQHQIVEARQTQQRGEQIKSMSHQTRKQQLVDQELLIQQETDERKQHIQNRIRHNRVRSPNQRITPGQPKNNNSACTSDSTSPQRPHSAPTDGQVKKQQFRYRIRAGLRSLLTFPTKQIKLMRFYVR